MLRETVVYIRRSIEIFIVLSLITACDAPGTTRLKELCEKNGLPKVYKSATSEEIYHDYESCTVLTSLIQKLGYEYLECKQPEGKSTYLDKGMYRISIVSQELGQCDKGLSDMVSDHRSRYQLLLENQQCFFVKEISGPASRYGIYQDDDAVVELDNIFGSIIVPRRRYIADHKAKDLVAESTSYYLYPTPGMSLSSFQRMKGCKSVVPGIRSVKSMTKFSNYVKPKKDMQL